MTTITVVMADKVIIKDGAALHFDAYADMAGDTGVADFDAVVAAQGHTNKWAIQWDGTTGSIEDADPTNNHILPTQAQIDAYIAAYDAEKARQLIALEASERARMPSADQHARDLRNDRLAETDWWANSDITMTSEQTAYRQALRDLPSTWNPVLTWDASEERLVLTGVTWPTKP